MKIIEINKASETTFLWRSDEDNVHIKMNFPGSSIKVIARWHDRLYLQSKYQIIVEHLAPHCRSSISIRTVLYKASKISINGLLKIANQADQSDAFLEERVLLLHPQAMATVVPDLEIANSNAKCSHAAAVGQPPFEQIWQLQSKGLPIKKAQSQIARAFLKS